MKQDKSDKKSKRRLNDSEHKQKCESLLKRLDYINSGKKFSRDEMNER